MKKIYRIAANLIIIGMMLLCIGEGSEVSAAGRSFLGKNNWLFYNAEGDGSTIYDYMGVNHYSKAGLKRVEKKSYGSSE